MFKKKEKVEITSGTPQFNVRYVGKTQTFQAGGKGCTRAPVQHIWDNAQEERYLPRVTMIVSTSGITLQDVENKKNETKFDIRHISYCCAEPGVHERIFTWISKNSAAKRLECHAVLCTSKEKAQAIAVVMSRSFHIAYKDWKSDKEKAARLKKADHQTEPGRPNSRLSRSSSDSSKSSHGDKALRNGVKHMNIGAGPADIDEFFFAHNVETEEDLTSNNNGSIPKAAGT